MKSTSNSFSQFSHVRIVVDSSPPLMFVCLQSREQNFALDLNVITSNFFEHCRQIRVTLLLFVAEFVQAIEQYTWLRRAKGILNLTLHHLQVRVVVLFFESK